MNDTLETRPYRSTDALEKFRALFPHHTYSHDAVLKALHRGCRATRPETRFRKKQRLVNGACKNHYTCDDIEQWRGGNMTFAPVFTPTDTRQLTQMLEECMNLNFKWYMHLY